MADDHQTLRFVIVIRCVIITHQIRYQMIGNLRIIINPPCADKATCASVTAHQSCITTVTQVRTVHTLCHTCRPARKPALHPHSSLPSCTTLIASLWNLMLHL